MNESSERLGSFICGGAQRLIPGRSVLLFVAEPTGPLVAPLAPVGSTTNREGLMDRRVITSGLKGKDKGEPEE